eukprot:483210-Prorocentrum_minimum.AAC.3
MRSSVYCSVFYGTDARRSERPHYRRHCGPHRVRAKPQRRQHRGVQSVGGVRPAPAAATRQRHAGGLPPGVRTQMRTRTAVSSGYTSMEPGYPSM